MSRRLYDMQRNPAADWRIKDMAALCRELGVLCEPARGGGPHYKVGHPRPAAKLTIPFKRPLLRLYLFARTRLRR